MFSYIYNKILIKYLRYIWDHDVLVQNRNKRVRKYWFRKIKIKNIDNDQITMIT